MKFWKQGFYEDPVEGGVEITDERWRELLAGQAAGQRIVEDTDGAPMLAEPEPDEPAATYEERVNDLIRERYSLFDELALLRQRDAKPEEFAAYYEFAEACKAQARAETLQTQQR